VALEWIERYDLRSTRETHEGWAIIHIDSNGFLGVVSDFGNYAYHWSAFEGDFKRFLGQLEADYLYGKLMQGRDARIYDGEATLRAIQKRILELRHKKRLTREKAREEWDLAKDSEVDDRFSNGYSLWYRDTDLEDAHELYETMYDRQCWAFCEKVWPRFVQAMKEGHNVQVQKEAS
jgi:hypothetical protein